MDEAILTAEVCTHYINRIHELTDDISSIKNNLGVASQITELNWSGESGQATLGVICKFDEKFTDINASLSEAMNIISGSVGEEEES